MLRDLSIPLKVLRKPVFWVNVEERFERAIADWPGFLYELPQGVFYGLPGLDGSSLKLAEHTGGQVVDDPHHATRDILPEDQTAIAGFIRQCVPAARPEFKRQSVCFYTMTSDAHFIIDRYPSYPNVGFGAGFSGHGFKFTSVLGQALAEMILEGSTSLPVDFLSLHRPSLAVKES
jgi:glycine/D-amino acid oxidase-like deaminating enzyme